ncbi:hypothetical protein AL755_05115 [Arthrobacter sp. ERGS1:01]|uniref:hypothetical protein n=1 Tax=Arthrobacter sp. ERGS1:01 TaxID=1704044 RepID=UPI0006B476C1|nr:hypothetical protein [Arthrobacter sp. ERGS1:01]ALE05014.1 hypothetical protein AL755_05115 [Arthrobacter sp. ERGS1:01]
MPAQKKRHRHAPPAAPAPEIPAFPVIRLPGAIVAEHLVGAGRTRPAVVVSNKSDAGARTIDAGALARHLGAEADVYELANGPETRALEAGLPAGLHIFGTGARVYPAGSDWATGPPAARLLGAGTVAQLTDQLRSDVRAAAAYRPAPAVAATPKPVLAGGTVHGFAAEDNSRALVILAGTGKSVTIRAEDLLPGVPLDWLLAPGQEVTGVLDARNGVLDISALLHRPGSPITVYANGSVALARVKSTCHNYAVVSLWPDADFRIGMERISSNELDCAEDLLTEGEVVRVRVLYENGALRPSMLDVDDDEPLTPAPALICGGPPWLAAERPYSGIFTAPSQPAPSATGLPGTGDAADNGGAGTSGVEGGTLEPALTATERRTALRSTQMELEKARHTITELLAAATRRGATDEIARALQEQLSSERANAAELARLHNDALHQIEDLRAEAVRARAKLVDARQQRRSAASRTESGMAALFVDPAEQFAFEVSTTWAHAVPAGDKATEPLGDYLVGPNFLASLAQLTPQQRTKTLRAVVDVAAGRQGPLRNREPHMLRENEGAHAAVQRRGDDVCWRLYVEQGTAGALRLHYWRLPDGRIELSRVVKHDEMKP